MTILLLIPLISAFIGWMTNWVAVKMLFHPREPLNLGFFKIQGIFPKRQAALADKLGKLVAQELINKDEIRAQLLDPGHLEKLYPTIATHMDHFLDHRLREKLPIISMFIGEGMMDKVREGMMEEIRDMLPRLMDQYSEQWSDSFDVEALVREKVIQFSSDKLESILKDIMKKEFRFIEIIGGVLGFLIGLFQVLLTQWAI